MKKANEVTSADGGWRVPLAFLAQWPAAAEFSSEVIRRGERGNVLWVSRQGFF
jgi:hypothetical protein